MLFRATLSLLYMYLLLGFGVLEVCFFTGTIELTTKDHKAPSLEIREQMKAYLGEVPLFFVITLKSHPLGHHERGITQPFMARKDCVTTNNVLIF